jgi:CRISPR/Cas system Type II protein with McrA/HNH and RuvC-like nuclease domain
MKEEILKLRNEGKTFNQIKEIIKCSKSTISYYCSEGQKEKTKIRTKKRRENIIIDKLERFKYRKSKSNKERIRKFNKRDNQMDGLVNKKIEITFTFEDVIKKFGYSTVCYLSGEKINLNENTYHFDHILPSSRGGDNTLENLGVTHEIVNKMKGDLTPKELILWCEKILKYNGYDVNKI